MTIDLACLCRRPLSNTGQGRRRLNARAALRAAGHDKQPQCGPVATSPHPHPQTTPMSTVAAQQPSLDMTEGGIRRKSKAMAGAYSSTYSKMQAQAQGHLPQPTMQLSLAEPATLESQELLLLGKLCQPSCVYMPCPEHLESIHHCMLYMNCTLSVTSSCEMHSTASMSTIEMLSMSSS